MTWYPPARKNPAVKDAGPMGTGYGWKLVIHTTESTGRFQPNPSSYGQFGHTFYPHFTLDRDGLFWQHIPIDRAARALKGSTKVETNRARAVQVECIGRSSADPDVILTDDQVDALRQLYVWLDTQVTLARVALPAGKIPGSATTSGPQRLSRDEWEIFSGICGHRHVPDNEHWDPGAFDLSRLLPPIAPPAPIPEEDDDMARLVRDEQGRVYKVGGNTRTYINEGATIAWLQAHGHVPADVEDIPTAVLRDAYPIESRDPQADIA